MFQDRYVVTLPHKLVGNGSCRGMPTLDTSSLSSHDPLRDGSPPPALGVYATGVGGLRASLE